nr:reverse transcriptase domain-containing protein [Tanacetum cinerariifolium]
MVTDSNITFERTYQRRLSRISKPFPKTNEIGDWVKLSDFEQALRGRNSWILKTRARGNGYHQREKIQAKPSTKRKAWKSQKSTKVNPVTVEVKNRAEVEEMLNGPIQTHLMGQEMDTQEKDKNQAKNDKTEHKMEKIGKDKVIRSQKSKVKARGQQKSIPGKLKVNPEKAVVAKVSTSSSTPAILSEVAELKDMVRALLLDKKNQSSAPTSSPTPAPVRAVEPNCVTYGGTHSYQNFPATSKNVYRDNIQEYVSQAAEANYNQGNTSFRPQMVANQIRPPGSGTLPSNTITNLKDELKGITTRSCVAYQGPTIPTPSKVVKQGTEVIKDQVQTPGSQSIAPVQPSVVQSKTQTLVFEPVDAPVSALMPNLKPSIPYPSRRDNERRRDQANEKIEIFYQIFKDMSFEISFTDALILMPKFSSILKALIGNKEKLSQMARTPMNEHCSAVILNKLPRKLGDPGKFLIPCEFLIPFNLYILKTLKYELKQTKTYPKCNAIVKENQENDKIGSKPDKKREADFQSSVNHNVYNPSSSMPHVEYAPAVYQQYEFSSPDTGLVVPVFQEGDDPIDAINHMMSFLTSVVTSRYAKAILTMVMNVRNESRLSMSQTCATFKTLFCGNGAHVGYNCPAQVPSVQTLPSFPQHSPCCEDSGVTHEPYKCQPKNHDYYNEQNACFDSNSFGFDQSQPQQYTVNHPIFNAHNDYLDSQIQLNKRAAKAQKWKLPVCYDDDDDEERSDSVKDNIIFRLPPFSAITPNEPVLSTEEPDNSLYQLEDFSESNKEFSSTDDNSFFFDKIDYVEASPPDSELVGSEVMEIVIQKVGGIKASNDNAILFYDPIISRTPLTLTPSGEKGDMLLLEAFLYDDHSSDFKTKSSSTSLNSLLEETNNFDNSLPEFTTFSKVLFDVEYESNS